MNGNAAKAESPRPNHHPHRSRLQLRLRSLRMRCSDGKYDFTALTRKMVDIKDKFPNESRVILMADLLRRIPLPLKLDCLSVASYHGGTKTTGELIFRQVSLPDIAGRHVLLLDDILDSGVTLATIREKIETAAPQSIRICVLLEKKKTRLRHVDADYVGFQIADEFVVGYGLDYMERYRNLPCIGVLRKDLIAATA